MKGKLLEEVQFLWSVVEGEGEGQKAPGGGDALERRVGADFSPKIFCSLEDGRLPRDEWMKFCFQDSEW